MPKQLLGSLPLVFALPTEDLLTYLCPLGDETTNKNVFKFNKGPHKCILLKNMIFSILCPTD